MIYARDYHLETRIHLGRAIVATELTRYRWAVNHGISTGTVYDILNKRPVSVKRLNTIRPLLGLPPITIETVKIDPLRQKVVNRQGPAPYVTRQVRLAPDDAERLDDLILRQWGYKSFSEWFHAACLEHLLEQQEPDVEYR